MALPAQNTAVATSLRWLPPPPGTFKLNSDGASKGNPGYSGGGRLIRSATDELFRAYAFKCGFCSALSSEIKAMLHGLLLAAKMGVSKLIAETDSMEVYTLLKDPDLLTHPDYYLVKCCWEAIDNTTWDFQIQHVRRQANQAAHVVHSPLLPPT